MCKIKVYFGLILSFTVFMHFSTNSLAFEAHSGWWFIQGKSGTGLSLEVQDEVLFAALYTYDNKGKPIWLSGILCQEGDRSYAGELFIWRGWPLNSVYSSPSAKSVGHMSLEFDVSNSDSASLIYSIDESSGSLSAQSVSVRITKFMPTVALGTLDSRDINGWWYDPAYNGMGWFIEVRGGVMFLAWYHYDDTGNLPDWHSCYNEFPEGVTSLACTLQHWSGGSPMGSESYIAPLHTDTGNVQLIFGQEGKMQFSWNGQTYNLERFYFGGSSKGALSSVCSSGDGSSGTECPDISGEWFVNESYTLNCSVSDGEQVHQQVTLHGIITINQDGCNVSFVPVSGDKTNFFSDIDLDSSRKNGYVKDDKVIFKGKVGVELTGQYGVSTDWRKNFGEFQGELKGNQIFFTSAKNELEGTVCGDGECADIKCHVDNYYAILTKIEH